MLGRCRRRVLLCDEGQPRNRWSRALHGYLTRDGIPPADLNALGRSELEQYGVRCRAVRVTDARRQDDTFHVHLGDGGTVLSRYLLIATGVVDEVPDVEGFAACYGRSVFHCPYCDGWEQRDRRLAAFGRGRSGAALALSLRTWSPRVVLLSHGSPPPSAVVDRLGRNDIVVIPARATRLRHDEGRLTAVDVEGGATHPLDALFFTAAQHPRCNLAQALGCAFNAKGTVDTGTLGNTNVPGVYVVGDASRDAQFAIVAAAEGTKAALAINQALQQEDLRP